MAHYRIAIDNFIDIVYVEDENITFLDTARNIALNVYAGWMAEEMSEWEDINNPTDEEKEHWNFMIDDAVAYIEKYNSDTDSFEVLGEGQISEEDLIHIGWVKYNIEGSKDDKGRMY